jgi:hypothetical protein
MITLTREEAQQVLDALVFATPSGFGPAEVYKNAVVLLQNRLEQPEPPCKTGSQCIGGECTHCAQPEPEPVCVAFIRQLVSIDKDGIETWKDEPLYITPPQRKEWIGLTEQEHANIAVEVGCASADWVFYGAAVERALKEKNT